MIHVRSEKLVERIHDADILVEMESVIIGFKQDFIHRIETTKDIDEFPVIHINGSEGLQFVNGLSINLKAGEIMENLVATIGMVINRRHGTGVQSQLQHRSLSIFKLFPIS